MEGSQQCARRQPAPGHAGPIDAQVVQQTCIFYAQDQNWTFKSTNEIVNQATSLAGSACVRAKALPAAREIAAALEPCHFRCHGSANGPQLGLDQRKHAVIS
jgi:hypothetical protein